MFELIDEGGRRRRVRRIRLVQEVIAGQQSVGNELDVASRRDIFQTIDGSELLRQSCDALRHIRPVIVFALAEDYAIKGHSPGLLRRVRKPQALEGDGKENDVAVVQDAPGVSPQCVEAVVVSLALGVDRIGLDPQGIREKIVGAVKVAVGVQEDAHAVVLIGSFAFRKMRANRAGFVVADKDRVQILVVVGEIGGTGLRCRRAVAGGVLAEIGDRQFGFARMVFQEIIQLGRAVHPGDFR